MADTPRWLRSFVTDFVEGSIASVLLLSLAMPASWDEAKAALAACGIAITHALVSAARRNAPAFYAWLRERLGTSDRQE